MVTVYGQPAESLGIPGMFEIDIHENFKRGKYLGGNVIVRIKESDRKIYAPFSQVAYSCGYDDKQCKACPRFPRCFPKAC